MINIITFILCASLVVSNPVNLKTATALNQDYTGIIESVADWFADTFSNAYKYYTQSKVNDNEEVGPAETKVAQTKPAETREQEATPAQAKAKEIKPAQAKVQETKPAQAKAQEIKPAQTKEQETTPAQTKVEETTPAQTKTEETGSADTGNYDKKEDQKTPDRKAEELIQEKGRDFIKDKLRETYGAAYFNSWTKNAAFIKEVEEFAIKAADESSDGYIPEGDRIAVFEFEGVLFSDNLPADLDTMLFIHRALDDNSYSAPKEIRDLAISIKEDPKAASKDDSSVMKCSVASAKAFAGMTVDEYDRYVKAFLESDAGGFTGLKLADGWYIPMMETAEYLMEKGFEIYIVTKNDRYTVRAAADGYLDIPDSHIIGSDISIKASNQGFDQGCEYEFAMEDDVVRGDSLVYKNLKANKVMSFMRETGKKPAIAFCSGADMSLADYTASNSEYDSPVYFVSADDNTREYADIKAASELAKKIRTAGYRTVSMKKDWKKLFGCEAEKNGK